MKQAVAFLLAVTAAEVITVTVQPIWGIICHILLLAGASVYAAVIEEKSRQRLFLSLTLVPLTRIISLSMPLEYIPQVWWYPLVYIPLLIAAWQVKRINGFSYRQIGMQAGRILPQLAITSTGLAFGLVEYLILRGEAEITGAVLLKTWPLSAFFLIACTGFVEEVGHIGITAGVIKASGAILSSSVNGSGAEKIAGSGIFRFLRELKDKAGAIDYRLVILGSILPDLIDKPVFLLFGNYTALSGRDYAHTLLFNLILLTGGLLLMQRGKSWLLVISVSSFIHLLLDRIWEMPKVILWPLLGPMPGAGTEGYLTDRLYSLLIPAVYIPEIIGLAILLGFFIRLLKNRGIIRFLTKGVVA
jgi:hypothetical protein